MKKKAWNKYINLLVQLAATMVISILFFLFLGLFFEHYLKFPSMIVVVGVFLGVACGFYLVYLRLRSFF